jgi:peptide/nickel transport system substrate-binding protein
MTLTTPTLNVKKARRIFRRRKKQVLAISEQADHQIDQLLIRRLTRLRNIRRFLFGWLGMMFIIAIGIALQVQSVGSYYLKDAAVEGGIYREGIVGSFRNANPLFATSQIDSAVSKLIFSGLLRYNQKNQLVGDLALDYKVTNNDKTYTVVLRDGVKWHDGQPFTSADVLFTYSLIQNADAKSPLFASWQGVKITTPDPLTVVFDLPSAFSPFVYSLTTGIIPVHILKDKQVASLRSDDFNTILAVGTGPFKMNKVDVIGARSEDRQEQITLEKYDEYHLGAAKLDNIVLKSYKDQDQLLDAFRKRELNAVANPISDISDIDDGSVKTFDVPLTSIVMLFMNNSSELLADVKVRTALVQGTDAVAIRQSLGYELKPADSPLLVGQLGYQAEIVQKPLDIDTANKLLDEAGWLRDASGQRVKDGKKLFIRLVTQSFFEYSKVSQSVQSQWAELGVQVDVALRSDEDIQGALVDHTQYDVLLHGIEIGKDPDVFAYWHSTQADVRSQKLNFSEYKSAAADEALEGGRTRIDPTIRKVKYQPFLEAWRNDAPAIALYQPRYRFMVRGTFDGASFQEFNSAIDRYATITNWMVRQDKVVKSQEDL